MTLHKSAAAEVLDRLEAQAPEIGRRMAQESRAHVKPYAAVPDPAFAAEVTAHAEQHVRAFVKCARARRPPAGAELDFVVERGVRRARELLPLDAVLESYHVGQRVVWESIVETTAALGGDADVALELTAITFSYTHAISVAIAAAYLRESQAVASETERARRDVLDLLIAGSPLQEGQVRRVEALGLQAGRDHVVVLAEPEPDDDGRALRLVALALAAGSGPDAFVVPRHDEVVAVLPVYVRRGPVEVTAAIARAADQLRRRHGVVMRAGVSAVCAGLDGIRAGLVEARRALVHAGPGRAAAAVGEIDLVDHLIAGADDFARRLVPAGVRRLTGWDARHGGMLATTIEAYAECDMNVASAAVRLGVHPNTVHYRLRRTAELSGRDPRRFADLTELLTALRLAASPAP